MRRKQEAEHRARKIKTRGERAAFAHQLDRDQFLSYYQRLNALTFSSDPKSAAWYFVILLELEEQVSNPTFDLEVFISSEEFKNLVEKYTNMIVSHANKFQNRFEALQARNRLLLSIGRK